MQCSRYNYAMFPNVRFSAVESNACVAQNTNISVSIQDVIGVGECN